MKNIVRSARALAAAFAAAGLLAVGGCLPAFAAADTGVTISGASLSGGGISFSNLGGVTLNGAQQTTAATWSIADITDPTGTGAGWHDSLTLTPFAEYNTGTSSYVTGGRTFAASSLKVTAAPTVSQVDSTSSAADTVTPVATSTALDTGSPVELESAALDGGMGSYSFGAMTVTLTVPANAYAATYKSDATVTLATAP